MPFQLFRTDDRPPNIIADDGFQARAPMSADVARQFVERSVVDPNTPLNLPVAAQRGVMADYFASNQNLVGLGSLYQEIRRETSQSTLHVSTSPNDGTGGIRRNHLYEIEVPAQQLYAWREGRLGRISVAPTEVSSLAEAHRSDNSLGLPSTRPVLLTNARTLQESTLFAISSPSGEGEVAFLTGIPREWTQRSRSLAQGGDWQPMPPPTQGQGAPTVAAPVPAVATPVAPVASSSSVSSPAVPMSTSSTTSGAPPASTTSLSSPAVAPHASQPGSSNASPATPWTASASSTQDYADGRRPPPLPARPLSMLTHPYQETGHPKHDAYEQARDGLQRLQPQRPPGERSLAAAALADAAHAARPPLPSIDHVAEGPNGRLFAVHGELRSSSARHAHVDPAQVQAQAQVAADYAAGRLAPTQAASASQSAPSQTTPAAPGQQPHAPNTQPAQAQQQEQQQQQPAQQEGGRVRALAAMFETPAPDQNQNQGGQSQGSGPRHR